MLSVVIPTFRKPELLARTLAALVDQELPVGFEWEVVVVDDGSGDVGTPEALESFRDRLPLVEAGSGANEGRSRARNRGWRAASGSWILFLDDDIVLDAGAVAAHAIAQSKHEAAYLGLVVTAEEVIDSTLFDYLDTRGVAKCDEGERVPARYFLTQNVSVPRAMLERVGGFDEDFGAYGFEDMELAFRLEDECELEYHALGGAVGEHIHHHTLEEYLEKKRICGAQTLPRLAQLHPGRMAEMRLDSLPTISAANTPLSFALSTSWRLGAADLVLELVRAWPPMVWDSGRHRAYDYLVLSAYAAGLVSTQAANKA